MISNNPTTAADIVRKQYGSPGPGRVLVAERAIFDLLKKMTGLTLTPSGHEDALSSGAFAQVSAAIHQAAQLLKGGEASKFSLEKADITKDVLPPEYFNADGLLGASAVHAFQKYADNGDDGRSVPSFDWMANHFASLVANTFKYDKSAVNQPGCDKLSDTTLALLEKMSSAADISFIKGKLTPTETQALVDIATKTPFQGLLEGAKMILGGNNKTDLTPSVRLTNLANAIRNLVVEVADRGGTLPDYQRLTTVDPVIKWETPNEASANKANGQPVMTIVGHASMPAPPQS